MSTEWDGEPFAPDEEAFTTQFRVRPDGAILFCAIRGFGNLDFVYFACEVVGYRVGD